MLKKVKIQDCTPESIEETRQIILRKCKNFYQSAPFSTKVYMALKTGVDITFIQKNWFEITGNKIMENELKLNESQLKRFEKLWFIYGNYGKKSTPLNHKLIQGFYQYKENRIEQYREGYQNMVDKFGVEFAEKWKATEECIKACEEILNNP